MKTNEASSRWTWWGRSPIPAVERSYLPRWDGPPRWVSAGEALSTTAKWATPASAGPGEKTEPGASAEGVGNDREKGFFKNLSRAFYVTRSVTEDLS